MKSFKKIIGIFLAVSMLAACGKSNGEASKNKADETKVKKVVYTSFYPLESLTKYITGDKMEVKNFIPVGMGVHGFEPTPKDIVSIKNADAFFINGVELEGFIDDIKKAHADLNIVDTSKGVNLIEGKHKHDEKHKHEEEHKHDEKHKHDKHSHKHHHGEYDPHIWLSLKNSKIILKNILDEVVKIDKDNEEYYNKNYNQIAEKIDALDKKYEAELKEIKTKYIIVQHQAFAYLCRDYNLMQKSLEGLNSDSEPDAATMAKAITFAKENNIRVIFYEKLHSSKAAESIAKEIGGVVKEINTIEGLTKEQMDKSEDYLSLMEKNLEVIKSAVK